MVLLKLLLYGWVLLNGGSDAAARIGESATSRVLEKEVTVVASLDEVWHAWTTVEGLATFFSKQSRVELRAGGAYDMFLNLEPDHNGKRGSEGCKVLSYLPKEMLSFEWTFPPSIPSLRDSGAKTHVVLRFDSIGERRVRVRFAQLGWQEGEDWDAGYAYFDKAWDGVLKKLQVRFQKSGSTTASAESVQQSPDNRIGGKVDFSILVRAEPERVYDALATGDGLDAWFTTGASVDARPGGSIHFRWKDWGLKNYTGSNDGPVLEAARPKRFVFQWRVDSASYRTTVEIDFEPVEGGTIVRLIEYGYEDSPAGRRDFLARVSGWAHVLTLMKFYLEHGVKY